LHPNESMINPLNVNVDQQKLGILHPGEMGLSIAASAQNSGHTVYWVSEGRSQQTAERAARMGLLDAHPAICR